MDILDYENLKFVDFFNLEIFPWQKGFSKNNTFIMKFYYLFEYFKTKINLINLIKIIIIKKSIYCDNMNFEYDCDILVHS